MKPSDLRPLSYFINRSEELRELGRFRQAETVIRRGLGQHPDEPRLLHLLARRLRMTKCEADDLEAMDCFARAWQQMPDDKFVTMDYAAFLTRKGRYYEAEILYFDLMRSEGPNVRNLSAIGNHFQARSEPGLAAAAFGLAASRPDADNYCKARFDELVSLHGQTVLEARHLQAFADRSALPQVCHGCPR